MLNGGEKSWQTRGMSIEDRLATRIVINPQSGCWEWSLHKDKDGYGNVSVNGKTRRAHVVSYETFRKQIPSGLVVDHLCRNRGCINPEHLEPITNRVNVIDRAIGIIAENAKKTHCKYGHDTLVLDPKINKRRCKTCQRIRWEAVNKRKKAIRNGER